MEESETLGDIPYNSQVAGPSSSGGVDNELGQFSQSGLGGSQRHSNTGLRAAGIQSVVSRQVVKNTGLKSSSSQFAQPSYAVSCCN